MALLKLGFVFSILLMAATINMSSFSKRQLVAARDVDFELSGLEKRLLPQVENLFTCNSRCTTDSDCSDGWICWKCKFYTADINLCKGQL
ncbi:hypothetical protein RND71_004152 [Anisodus tanguticus]|uniref:Carboxypeptidase A inhibitor-like domain-containing protein n=1 Tax=Anisodus tanguticus TaxID=243964 RepID=A0AAE1T032_9SOLA|nr:hypothetical protein RND71_004152 [Anisodus tanguticus]